MRNKDNTINLEDYRVKIGENFSKVFTGRNRGKEVRENSKIDKLEETCDDIYVIIPDNVYSINPSFLEELLVNVVTKLGKEDFLKKFHFISDGDYEIEIPLNQAIDRILKNKSYALKCIESNTTSCQR